MKKRVMRYIVVLCLLALLISIGNTENVKSDVPNSGSDMITTEEEFYDVVVNQFQNGEYGKEYKISFDPTKISIEKLSNRAVEVGGYELLAKFSHWSYSYSEIEGGYKISVRTGFIISELQEKKINFLAFMMAQKCKNMSDYEKIKYVYDYVILHCSYDVNKSGVYNAMFPQKCCCNGYAAAFYKLVSEMGIDCKFTVNETHAWNTVYLDGEWYNLDTTWGDKGDEVDYTYFLKNNADWQGMQVPEATASKSYPAENLDERYFYPPYVLITNIVFFIYVLMPFILIFYMIKFLRKRAYRKVQREVERKQREINNLYKCDD